MNTFQAAIFDMDGLLLDTETIALETFIDACKAYDKVVDNEVYYKCIGTNGDKTKEILMNEFGKGFPHNEFHVLWSEKYKYAITNYPIPVKDGVKDFLRFVQESHLKMIVATSTAYDIAVQKLESTKLDSFFDGIVGGDQVKRAKPDPEIYLKASQMVNVPPEQCFAFEDSENGVLAAHGAGVYVIQIPDLVEPTQKIKDLGHPILPTFEMVKALLTTVQ